METSLNPWEFMVAAIANIVLALICIVGQVIVGSQGGLGLSIGCASFISLCTLASMQYRAARAVKERFHGLEARLKSLQQPPTKELEPSRV